MSEFYLSEQGILRLIESPKKIVGKKPRNGFAEKGEYRDCRLKLYSNTGDSFEVFTNQHKRFPKGFSIGLIYKTEVKEYGDIVLVRYNGVHGTKKSIHPDGHFSNPHIHRITAAEIALGSSHPQENDRKITDKYEKFEDALDVFSKDIRIINYSDFFSDIQLELC